MQRVAEEKNIYGTSAGVKDEGPPYPWFHGQYYAPWDMFYDIRSDTWGDKMPMPLDYDPDVNTDPTGEEEGFLPDFERMKDEIILSINSIFGTVESVGKGIFWLGIGVLLIKTAEIVKK